MPAAVNVKDLRKTIQIGTEAESPEEFNCISLKLLETFSGFKIECSIQDIKQGEKLLKFFKARTRLWIFTSFDLGQTEVEVEGWCQIKHFGITSKINSVATVHAVFDSEVKQDITVNIGTEDGKEITTELINQAMKKAADEYVHKMLMPGGNLYRHK